MLCISHVSFWCLCLTSVIGKVMESIVRDSMVNYMMDNNLFCNAQHGFVLGCSCMVQLLVTIEKWTEFVDQGCQVNATYLDFEKAFDSVPRKQLLLKLSACGIDGSIYVCEWHTIRLDRCTEWYSPMQHFISHLIHSIH